MYMGSKKRLAKYIAPIVSDKTYYEPFVGSAAVTELVSDSADIHVSDYNPHLMRMYEELLANTPPEWFTIPAISESDYKEIRQQQDGAASGLVAAVGFGCSFGGKWWGGFARDKTGRNYWRNCTNSLKKQRDKLLHKRITLGTGSYEEQDYSAIGTIYCDPPYAKTTKYNAIKGGFNSDRFWLWCQDRARDGHRVFVSEFTGPNPSLGVSVDIVDTWLRKSDMVKREGDVTYDTTIEKLFKVGTA